MIFAAINPYRNTDFFDFFSVLFRRISLALQGGIGFEDLVSDEIQLICLLLLSICSAPIGFFLFYRKMTMMANALCHTILLGIVVAFLVLKSLSVDLQAPFLSLKALLVASMATAFLTTFLINFLIHKLKVQKDASIGIIFTSLFALGVVLATLFTKNVHLGTEAIMGSIDALAMQDMVLLFWIAIINTAFFLLFFKAFTISTFDPLFSSSIGMPINALSYLLMTLTSFTAIGAFRAVGVLLVLTFFVAPPLVARLIATKRRSLFFLCFLLPSVCSLLCISTARHILTVYGAAISTAGLFVTIFGVFFLLFAVISLYKQPITHFFKNTLHFFYPLQR